MFPNNPSLLLLAREGHMSTSTRKGSRGVNYITLTLHMDGSWGRRGLEQVGSRRADPSVTRRGSDAALSSMSVAVLGKLLSLSVAQFPHLEIRMMTLTAPASEGGCHEEANCCPERS